MPTDRITPDGDLTLLDQHVSEVKENFEILRNMPVAFRKSQLANLKKTLLELQPELTLASKADLGADPCSVYNMSMLPVIFEIDDAISNLDSWSARRQADSLAIWYPATHYIEPVGRGIVCVLGSWNVPMGTTILPAVSAIAAGNCVIIKPSEFAPESSDVMKKLCDLALDKRFYRCIEGGVQTSIRLTNTAFDYIVFTGGTSTGKIVAATASKHLTPCVLELGGKCPAIVDACADLNGAAMRIASGKWQNSGQVCISSDYCMIHEDVYEEFKELLVSATKKICSENAEHNPYFGRMIHKAHCKRTWEMLGNEHTKIIFQAGKYDLDNKFLPPTIIENVSPESLLMQEEIFGPILPILKFSTKEFLVREIEAKGRPLAIYYFGENGSATKKHLQDNTRSGQFVTNDVSYQFINHHLPFGGVGDSGYGTTKGIHGNVFFIKSKNFIRVQPIEFVEVCY